MIDMFFLLVSIWLVYSGISTYKAREALAITWKNKSLPRGELFISSGAACVFLSGVLIAIPLTRKLGLMTFNVFLLISLLTIHQFWKKEEFASVLKNLAYIGLFSIALASTSFE